ncbi:type III secretion system effector protein [Morganella sp. GD04133]|uniref:type III secretion system effector protein n=1 Tax=Morganella sp. GD04133 TaxID=2975435 RepID=UPI00244D2FBB|nr:type III secretion system effector protein [Morganella sp. GD04133]MDH0354238.1 type III secretion system effector protein [Morganella sp. GD04133]
MCRVVFSENYVVSHDVNLDIEKVGSPVNQPLSVNGSADVQGSSKGMPDVNDFLAMFDEIFSRLLLLMKQLRDTLQLYNQKKQELSWGLEVNTLKQSVKAINDSFDATAWSAAGGILSGGLMCAGAGVAAFRGEAWMMVGNAAGQIVNGIGTCFSGAKNRSAEQEKAIAELQNKGAQSYAKTLDDTLMKGREFWQQAMDRFSNYIEASNQMLRALFRY